MEIYKKMDTHRMYSVSYTHLDVYKRQGIDYSEQMLMHALENAKDIIPDIADSITFRKMDAQNLEFEDNSFDVILSRNLTWGLEHPVKAYQEWLRVLCPGGENFKL